MVQVTTKCEKYEFVRKLLLKIGPTLQIVSIKLKLLNVPVPVHKTRHRLPVQVPIVKWQL
jgi:hypothetical protein